MTVAFSNNQELMTNKQFSVLSYYIPKIVLVIIIFIVKIRIKWMVKQWSIVDFNGVDATSCAESRSSRCR